jgi:Cu(I)/Ag(I) efflux system membrane fusion protein
MNKLTIKYLMLGIVIGVVVCVSIYALFITAPSHPVRSHTTDAQSNASADEPLYWVAPMDPNFKRDKPGKSPMGMDLVPVYDEDNASDSPGTIKIDPIIVQNLGVKTAPVKKVLPSQTIRSFGKVHYSQDKISHVHPRVEGWIEKLYVRKKGDPIKKGAPLYSLYSPELVNAQEEYLIALEQNNRALIGAARSRLLALNSPKTLVDAIEKTREIQRTITYYASQTGVVSELNIQEGFYVKPATTMLAIASLDSVWVLADIFASDLNKLRIGDNANIQFDHRPALSVDAQLEYIYPTINRNTRTATVRFVLPNDELALKPDMYADVEIQHLSTEQVLVVPNSAVIRTGTQKRVVIALGEGKYKSIEVTLGTSYHDMFEVLDGLVEGDLVVTSAQFLLDSESSISSDFSRMEMDMTRDMSFDEGRHSSMPMDEGSQTDVSAWTQATLNEVMLDSRIVNLTHGPLDEFNMMGMTMNFTVSPHIDIAQFAAGQSVHVEIIKGSGGMYQLNTVHFIDSGSAESTDHSNEHDNQRDNEPLGEQQ